MKRKRARSRGVRNPGRNALLFGLATVAGIVLILLGMGDTHETGRSGSPLLMPGIFLVIPGLLFFVHYSSKIRVFRALRSGRGVIARWTVPAEEFKRFCEEEARVPARSIMVNFYKPPRNIPPEGVEVVFSDEGVLIGDGYFPLSITRGRRVGNVRRVASDPSTIEFGMTMTAMARTSSATVDSSTVYENLRVPVASDAERLAAEVVRRYEARLRS